MKRRKPLAQVGNFQNTVVILQPLIGEVLCIMSKEKISLLVFPIKFHIFVDSTPHTYPLYNWKFMSQHRCCHMADNYTNSDLSGLQKTQIYKNL